MTLEEAMEELEGWALDCAYFGQHYKDVIDATQHLFAVRSVFQKLDDAGVQYNAIEIWFWFIDRVARHRFEMGLVWRDDDTQGTM